MNKVMRLMAMLILHKSEEYAKCIQVDPKLSFQKCSLYREQPISRFDDQDGERKCSLRLLSTQRLRYQQSWPLQSILNVRLAICGEVGRLLRTAPREHATRGGRNEHLACISKCKPQPTHIWGAVVLYWLDYSPLAYANRARFSVFSHVGFVSHDAAGGQVFSGISPLTRENFISPCHWLVLRRRMDRPQAHCMSKRRGALGHELLVHGEASSNEMRVISKRGGGGEHRYSRDLLLGRAVMGNIRIRLAQSSASGFAGTTAVNGNVERNSHFPHRVHSSEWPAGIASVICKELSRRAGSIVCTYFNWSRSIEDADLQRTAGHLAAPLRDSARQGVDDPEDGEVERVHGCTVATPSLQGKGGMAGEGGGHGVRLLTSLPNGCTHLPSPPLCTNPRADLIVALPWTKARIVTMTRKEQQGAWKRKVATQRYNERTLSHSLFAQNNTLQKYGVTNAPVMKQSTQRDVKNSPPSKRRSNGAPNIAAFHPDDAELFSVSRCRQENGAYVEIDADEATAATISGVCGRSTFSFPLVTGSCCVRRVCTALSKHQLTLQHYHHTLLVTSDPARRTTVTGTRLRSSIKAARVSRSCGSFWREEVEMFGNRQSHLYGAADTRTALLLNDLNYVFTHSERRLVKKPRKVDYRRNSLRVAVGLHMYGVGHGARDSIIICRLAQNRRELTSLCTVDSRLPSNVTRLEPRIAINWTIGHLKTIVYATPIPDISVLRQRAERRRQQTRAIPGVLDVSGNQWRGVFKHASRYDHNAHCRISTGIPNARRSRKHVPMFLQSCQLVSLSSRLPHQHRVTSRDELVHKVLYTSSRAGEDGDNTIRSVAPKFVDGGLWQSLRSSISTERLSKKGQDLLSLIGAIFFERAAAVWIAVRPLAFKSQDSCLFMHNLHVAVTSIVLLSKRCGEDGREFSEDIGITEFSRLGKFTVGDVQNQNAFRWGGENTRGRYSLATHVYITNMRHLTLHNFSFAVVLPRRSRKLVGHNKIVDQTLQRLAASMLLPPFRGTPKRVKRFTTAPPRSVVGVKGGRGELKRGEYGAAPECKAEDPRETRRPASSGRFSHLRISASARPGIEPEEEENGNISISYFPSSALVSCFYDARSREEVHERWHLRVTSGTGRASLESSRGGSDVGHVKGGAKQRPG
ncbi:hypothetical protein PR048_002397 [Dryococelus australis]|uniref:Uncharacterized protein n=1 Tax=Dryococelus australis TaxID=614101 RepID=A0ABQ9IL43_9NEOP|nr:hypothetical protein PR048_002397 [Dryococelus australis]